VDYKSQPSVGGYKTRFFDETSMQMLETMKRDGLSKRSLSEFVAMEDQFLAYEKESVCNRVSRLFDASMLSQQIKDRFPGYDFKYHNEHIRQMSQPNKLINKKLTCW
jgi:hypothetical protein